MKYILYCRKSSEAEDRQVLSIESQIQELKKIAEKDNLEIAEILTESKSAKDVGRPIFNLMIEKIKNGEANAILCWKLDRLARNMVDGGNIIDLLQKSKIRHIQTFGKDYNPNDNVLLMSIEFGMANQYIRELSENVKRGNRAKLEKGGWPSPAPRGYLNDKANKTIMVDKKMAKYIIKAFELYATGGYTLNDVANILYDDGLRSKSGQKIRKGQIHRIIIRPFYYGVMFKNQKYYKGNHEPIINKNLFDRANSVLFGNHHQKKEKHFFTYSGFMKCENCGCVLTATKKREHIYYYCTNGKGNCEQHKKYLKEKEIIKITSKIFNRFKFDDELIEIAYQASKEKSKHKKGYSENSKQNIQDELLKAENKASKLLDSYLSELIPKNAYEAKMRELNNNKIDLELQLREIEKKIKSGQSTLEQTKKVFLTANTAKKGFLSADEFQKREYLKILLWNISFENGKMANCRLKMPYSLLTKSPKKGNFATML